eukprot:CAMPEP_0178410970 /NCGR_PEP_ID=MMETSP0689_2-20121128/21256_1 /TAXON_ID=160604 /ORGANISM="Amphidinium massartii, Strain CS-259" /LENGTH=241 /DNA_ID=CAMNT_0020032167 /DNA_START=94 /DNA_END=819 /DNA_ORIENTATION=-
MSANDDEHRGQGNRTVLRRYAPTAAATSRRRFHRQLQRRPRGLRAVAVAVLCCIAVPLLVQELLTVARHLCFTSSEGVGASRRDLFVSAAGTVLPVLGGQAVSAAESLALWEGRYSDLDHPGCRREIVMKGLELTMNYEDSETGCGVKVQQKKFSATTLNSDRAEGSTVREVILSGSIADKMSTEVTFDFSPVGGPSSRSGRWGGFGIIWEDGTSWARLSGINKGSALRRQQLATAGRDEK